MTKSSGRPAELTIPPLIKRNTIIFAITQSLSGAGYQLAYGLGPLIVVGLTGNAVLAGLSVALLGASRFLVAYPIGRITDTFGRKPGITVGLLVGLLGGLLVGLSLILQSIALFIIAILVFGMGMSAAQQLRVAAADMFPPNRRGEALGYILMGSLLGVLTGPFLVGASERVSPLVGLPTLSLPWLMLPVLIVPSMLLVLAVRPDPKEIGANLERYYPGIKLPLRTASAEDSGLDAWDLLRHFPTRLSIVANCAGQANMTIVMVLTSLVLDHHGHSLAAISISQAFHSTGMYVFSIPFGRLSDRFGAKAVLLWGVGTTLIGAGLVAFTEQWWTVTLGTFLVGAGWSAANIASTAQIADGVATHQRGRAVGFNDTFAGAITVVLSAITGPVVQYFGIQMTGLLAVAVAAAPFLMLVRPRPNRTEGHSGRLTGAA